MPVDDEGVARMQPGGPSGHADEAAVGPGHADDEDALLPKPQVAEGPLSADLA